MLATKSRLWYVVGLTFLGSLVTAGCDHITDPEGPNLTDRFGDFFVVEPLEASRAEVDFAAGQDVVFTASFNKQVDWILEITGQTSGAVKRIEGFSNELSAENARWQGGTTELPFFKTESAEAVLLIVDEDTDTLRTTVEVLTPRVYEGSLAADFEAPAGSNIFLGNFEFELDPSTGRSSEVPAAEGDFFYLLRGTEPPSGGTRNFFVGLIDIKGQITGNDYFPVPTTVPENLYFNMFLYSFGTPNTIAVVQLIADANGNGTFEDGTDTVFPYSPPDTPLNVDWEGWRAFSRSLDAIGMNEDQAQQIVAIRVLLISDNNTQPTPPLEVEYGIDYITFTAGAPLQL